MRLTIEPKQYFSKMKTNILALLILFFLFPIYGQKTSDVLIVNKIKDAISIPDATFIKEITIKTKWFSPLKPSRVFINQAIDSTRLYGGNTFQITRFKKVNYYGYSIFNKEKYARNLKGKIYYLSEMQVSEFKKIRDSIRAKKRKRTAQRPIYVGLSVGSETVMGLPKVSFYNFQKRNSWNTYYAAEGSLWFVEALWFSADVLYGVQKNFLTFDTSVGVWWYPYIKEYKTGPYFHATLNPKIGIRLGKVWLKAGPSFILYKDYAKGNKPGVIDMTKINNVAYNFEIQFKMN